MIGQVYRTVQNLSLDIVIGAIILLRFFCVHFHVRIGWQIYALLGISVWVIYTIDHLKDAGKAPHASRERYVFHRRYRELLRWGVLCMLILAIYLLFSIPSVIVMWGSMLAIFSGIYLFFQQKLSSFFFKEIYVALAYSTGILLTPMLMSETFQWSVFLLLFLLTFSNLVLFSWYERAEDMEDGFISIATKFSNLYLERILLLLVSIGISLCLMKINILHLYFMLGFLIYSLLIVYPSGFSINHRYRTIGDSVFLLPILFEWL